MASAPSRPCPSGLSPSPASKPGASAGNVTSHHQKFTFGGVSLRLAGASAIDVHGGNEMLAFRSMRQSSIGREVEVEVRWADALQAHDRNASFESGAIWRVYDFAGEFVFDFTSPLLGHQPYKRMHVQRDFSRAEVILSRSASQVCGKISALEYPLCELLITNYLACHGLGIEVHGCGLIDRDTGGHLFLGHSGAGKSTTARLWENLRAPEILSDDRIILRIHNGELWMYGTPWHGEAAFASPERAKIDRIHILRHGHDNKFSAVPQARAVAEVFARCFPPFYSPMGVAGTVDFIQRSLDIVPCYEFNFLPDRSSLAAVLEFHG